MFFYDAVYQFFGDNVRLDGAFHEDVALGGIRNHGFGNGYFRVAFQLEGSNHFPTLADYEADALVRYRYAVGLRAWRSIWSQ